VHYLTMAIMPDGVTTYTEARDVVQRILEPHVESYDGYDEGGDGHRGVWDWYQVGGRWTGFYSEYDPEKDPRNIYAEDKFHHKKGEVKWPTDWVPFEGDLVPVAWILNLQKFPVYVFTPDGRCVGDWDEKDKTAIEQTLTEAKDKLALVVDCHS